MFKLYDTFGFRASSKKDLQLSEEEEIIVEEFEKSRSETIKLLEARGRISFIEGTPRLPEVTRAIEKRNYVSIQYTHKNGEKGHRLIEPYAMGKGYKLPDGRVVNKDKIYIRVFVIMNSETDKTTKGRFAKTKSVSVSDKRKRWRMIRLDRINRWTNMEKVFSSYRKLYNPNDKQMSIILSSLPKSSFPKGENPKISW